MGGPPVVPEGMDIICTGITETDRRELLAGYDANGLPVEPFTDTDGGWPLRCCLRLSIRGVRLAIVAWSPFAWTSPYRETGPVVVHAEDCPGHDGSVPGYLEERDQAIKAFGEADGRSRTQVYDRNRLVRAGEGLRAAVLEVLADPRVEEVHLHNVLSQCWNATVRRA